MIYLKWLLSPLGKVLSLVLAVLAAFGTVYIRGRQEGSEAERERSQKIVKKVQGKMDKETEKTVTDTDVQDRLKDGTF